MTEQYVDVASLVRATFLWRAHAQAMTSAANAVADADTSGFDPAVATPVASFLSTWSAVTQRIADDAEQTHDALDAGRRGYLYSEYEAQEEFNLLFGVVS